MAGKNARGYAARLKREQAAAAALANQLLPKLSEDPDWALASTKAANVPWEQHARRSRALTRLTKRAVRAMYPEHACSVRRSASEWVHVDLKMPELQDSHVRGTLLHGEYEYKAVCRRVENVLVALGLKYPTRLTDFLPGSDEWVPCLTVTVNGYC